MEFHTEEGFDFSLKQKTKLKEWIESALTKEKKKFNRISFFFCSDRYLLKINQTFLKHDSYTDIITFDYSDNVKKDAEILISIERVKENAAKFKVSFNEELKRTMIHGILHLCGYKDKKPEEKKIMRLKEDVYLRMIPS